MLLRKFCPHERVDSLDQIDLAALYDAGMRGIIVDIDNTLVAWDSDTIGESSRAWVFKAKELGYAVCLVSNGRTERVQRLAAELGVPGFANAIKPRKKGFLQALAALGTPPEQTAIVGDQIFTDVLGGNRTGLYTIWVRPLSDKELVTTQFMRRLERRLVRKMEEKGLLRKEQDWEEKVG
ncbi:MAG: YqeG family HAD IIIA-type phosphatase [Firmicutes bacterium]|nr:YqeG family HAD IIIA-type phosphatase [Bacillota bacterium]